MIKKKHNLIASQATKLIRKISSKKKLHLHQPLILKNDFLKLKKCLYSTNVSSASSYTLDFEDRLSKFTKSKYAIALINGTAALEIAIRTLNIKKDDEIFIPSLNYVASSNATLYCGAIPHFVDIELENFGVDVKKLEKYIIKYCIIKNNNLVNKSTKRIIRAIIPTHIFGVSCNIDELLILSKKYKLKIIEDAAEALGSTYQKKHLGTFGDIGVLSFNGNKIITTGGGGSLLTQNKTYYTKALRLVTIAKKTKNYWKYDYHEMGFNYRLPGLNSALGISQLKKIKKILLKKSRNQKKLNFLFSNNKYLKFVEQKNSKTSNYWLNNLYIFKSNLTLRDKIIEEMIKNEIFVRPVWKLMSKIKYLSQYPRMNLDNSIAVEKSLISIPSSPNL
jgi:perosamine synthetase|tara:strand:+ start:271 stop:1443 length:1173 start_codon:yes stop_codon:yes gene_type:complete